MKYIKLYIIPLLILAVFMACSIDDTSGPEVQKPDTPNLLINEFMASNDAANTDEYGGFDDWFEIYNADSVAVDIGGYYVTDNLDSPDSYQIPKTDPAKTTIQPGGFLVLWADKDTLQGVTHVDFRLSGDGEAIGLVMPDGRTFVDQLTYDAQQTDFSYGRNPDGSDNWQVYAKATPGASNTGASTNLPPQISNVSVSPDSLTASTEVVVSAKVSDENLQSVTITYGEAEAISNTATMTLSDSLYQANLGTFNDGTRVFFYITATDEEAESTVSDTLSFEVGYIAPVLFINEFMASNSDSSIFADENGDHDDWIEIYNPGSEAVDIGGMYITDGLDDLTAWQIPDRAPDSTTIQPGGFLVLYADKQSEQGILHVEIKLFGSGEQIGLTAPNGTTVIDSLTYDANTDGAIGYGLETDKSCGRQPDGSNNWVIYEMGVATPGASNQ